MAALRVLHLSRPLLDPPPMPAVEGVAIRPFAGQQDIAAWLELRSRAFANQTPAVRPWTQADFAAEFLTKSWWSPERFWLAEEGENKPRPACAIGAVALALRGQGPMAMPVVHWLMVAPEWRRRGVGRLLMATLEGACWQAGHRQVALETHASWASAEAFYRSLGYTPLAARPQGKVR